MSNKWINYWSKKNIWASTDLWSKNANVYFSNLKKLFSLDNKKILDLGCGSGELIELLLDNANKVYGVDVSKHYVEICKKKFSKKSNVKIKHYLNNYNNLLSLNCNFDLIFCNSVIQYFSSTNEIVNLVKSVKEVSNPRAKFLISDIMDINSKRNFANYMYLSIKRGYFFSLVKQFAVLLINSRYRSLETEYKLLEVYLKKLILLLRPYVKKMKIIDYPITINTERKHLLIEF